LFISFAIKYLFLSAVITLKFAAFCRFSKKKNAGIIKKIIGTAANNVDRSNKFGVYLH
jgi:hypothetical protein